MKYVIEHLEPRLYKWCLIEYKHMSKNVGKSNLIITNIKNKKEQEKLKPYAKVYDKSIKQLNFKKCCLLDANAKKILTKNDCRSFNYLIFGGILGDAPPRARTMQHFNDLKLPIRSLGKKQMPTDTAVIVADKICKGTPLNKIKFKDNIEINLKDGESVIFPFRYIVENNNILISDELIEHLKKVGF